jgi:hypothetical protein
MNDLTALSDFALRRDNDAAFREWQRLDDRCAELAAVNALDPRAIEAGAMALVHHARGQLLSAEVQRRRAAAHAPKRGLGVLFGAIVAGESGDYVDNLGRAPYDVID